MEPVSLILIIACFVLVIIIIVAVSKSNTNNIITDIPNNEISAFEEFYEKLINTDSEELNKAVEDVRKENSKKKKVAGTSCLMVDILLILFMLVTSFLDSTSYNGMSSIFSGIIFAFIINIFIIIVVNLIFSKKLTEYNKKYKEIIINKIISNFYDCLEYSPNSAMPEEEYHKLNYEYYDKYKSEDYFEAKINGKYNIKMAEILTEEIKETVDDEGNTTRTTENVFWGLFSKISLDKQVVDELIIMPNGKLLFDNKTKMDSTVFEKKFDVKSSDRIVAMQILTSDVMEDLVKLQSISNFLFDIVIKDNELYLRFYTGDMFEPGNVKGGIFNKALIQQYYFVMRFTYVLSDKLISIINDI